MAFEALSINSLESIRNILPTKVSQLYDSIIDVLEDAQTAFFEAEIPGAYIDLDVLSIRHSVWFGELVFLTKITELYDTRFALGEIQATEYLDQVYYCAVFCGSTTDDCALEQRHVFQEVAQKINYGKSVTLQEVKAVITEYIKWLYYALLTTYYHEISLEQLTKWEETADRAFVLAVDQNDSTLQQMAVCQLDYIHTLLASKSLNDTVSTSRRMTKERERVYILHCKLESYIHFAHSLRQLDETLPIYSPHAIA